ncbi:cytochrome oxidase putative small subunit CydP [Paraburkholderia sp. J76]|uniref:cytochrome oxidase putative small subunit CydP n=1 Tax=Paraburkholderia sp. J76 TaxID=2805439 RepID=UPI002ABE4A35|nr:cytochrome oxidase putative small subunit CydP [Paraburkholderia sp. J76]
MIPASGQRQRTPSLLRTRIQQWMRGPTFARDIALVLAVKLVLLMALKYAFFNHPQAEDMKMPPAAVAQAILAVPMSSQSEPSASQPQTRPQRGDRHAHD